jgi:hypothetical protein
MTFGAATALPYFTWLLSFPAVCTDLRTVADKRRYKAFSQELFYPVASRGPVLL